MLNTVKSLYHIIFLKVETQSLSNSLRLLNHSVDEAIGKSTVCVSLNVERKLLSHENCSSHLPALCGYYLDRRTSIYSLKPEVPKCPDGWRVFENNCYRPENGPCSWHEAEARCVQLGGSLVSIESEEEDTFVHSLVSNLTQPRSWIGLRVLCKYVFG